MKCLTCKFYQGEAASMDYPYPVIYCAKGHWEDAPREEIETEENHHWDNCKDYEPASK